MRLLQMKNGGGFTLTEFFANFPPYAILSHTWGAPGEEVTFQDLVNDTGQNKTGYKKIEFCGQRALDDGLHYFWCDMCCIDKTSSSELTEAINSMFRWYRNSARCYVYLQDVSKQDPEEVFRNSRWFTRGWTLQELIAPGSVEFFSREGSRLGDKAVLEREIHEITGIDISALRGHLLSKFSIEERLSWAKGRQTTREEDETYCLLGLFDVHMPLIYGEGKKAFLRLNEEINKPFRDIVPRASAPLAPVQTPRVSAPQSIQNHGPTRAEIIQSLKCHDPHTNHLAAQKKKQAHTGSWFLRGKQYTSWEQGRTPFVWISGSPGFGKTVLCSTIIENLLETHQKDPSVMLAYYYFDFSETNNRTLDSFIRTLIVQLISNLPELPRDLLKLFKQIQDRKQEPSTEILTQALCAVLMEDTKAIIVVDALDECSQPEEFVQLISEMRSWKPKNLRLLVVSRQHFEGSDDLGELQPVQISMQDELTNNDISMFVEEVLSKDIKLRKWPPHIKSEIKFALVSKSNGMFRWVACQTDVLRKCRTQQDVDRVLSTLPPTLEETYDRILDNIDDSYKTEVRAVLQWLAFAERPMRLEEIAEIVAFDESHTNFDAKRRLLNPLEILVMCSSLLVVNKTYYYQHYDYGKVTVSELRLAHFTVKDYLLSKNLQTSRHSYYSLEEKASNLQIAKACLTYLNMDEFSSGYRGKKQQDEILKEWPLIDYAARHCGPHISLNEATLDPHTKQLLQTLLASHLLPRGGNFGTLVGTVWYSASFELIQTTKPLYFAASYGLVSVLQLLLASNDKGLSEGGSGLDLEARGGRYGSTALEVAAYKGRTECVRLLLAAGADPNSVNYLGETALAWARMLGFEEIEKMLLEYGAKTTR